MRALLPVYCLLCLWRCAESADECNLSQHNCDNNATCTDTISSFTCACNSPYTGDGLICLFIQYIFYDSVTDLPVHTMVAGETVPFSAVNGTNINIEARVHGQYAHLVDSVRLTYTSPFTNYTRVENFVPWAMWGNSGTNQFYSGTFLQYGESPTFKVELYDGPGGSGSLLFTEETNAYVGTPTPAPIVVVSTALSIDYGALCGSGSMSALTTNFEQALATVEAWKSARLSEGADAETVQATADEEVEKINLYVLQVCIPQLSLSSDKEEAAVMVFQTALKNLKDQKSASTTSSEAMADIQTEGGNFLNHLNGITDLLAPVLSETGTEKVTFEVPGGGLTGTVGLVPSDGSPMEVESPSASVRIELPSPLGVGDPLGEQGGVGGYVNPWPEVRGAIPVVNRLSAPPRYILLLQSLVSPVPFAGERTREGGFVMGRMVGEFFRLASRESSRVVSQSRVPLFQPDRLGVQGERSTRRRRLGVSADEAGGSAGLMTLTVEYPKETAQTSLIESLELEFPQVVALKGGEWIRECAQLDVQNEIWTSAGCESPNINADLSSAVCTCILRTLDTVIVLALRYIPPEKLTPTSVSNDGAILPDNNVEDPFANGFQWLLTSSGLFMVMLLLAVASSEAQERADFPTLKIASSGKQGKGLWQGKGQEKNVENPEGGTGVDSLAGGGIVEIIKDSLHFTRLKQHFNPRRVIAFRTARQKNKEEKGGEGKESGKQCCPSNFLVRVCRRLFLQEMTLGVRDLHHLRQAIELQKLQARMERLAYDARVNDKYRFATRQHQLWARMDAILTSVNSEMGVAFSVQEVKSGLRRLAPLGRGGGLSRPLQQNQKSKSKTPRPKSRLQVAPFDMGDGWSEKEDEEGDGDLHDRSPTAGAWGGFSPVPLRDRDEEVDSFRGVGRRPSFFSSFFVGLAKDRNNDREAQEDKSEEEEVDAGDSEFGQFSDEGERSPLSPRKTYQEKGFFASLFSSPFKGRHNRQTRRANKIEDEKQAKEGERMESRRASAADSLAGGPNGGPTVEVEELFTPAHRQGLFFTQEPEFGMSPGGDLPSPSDDGEPSPTFSGFSGCPVVPQAATAPLSLQKNTRSPRSKSASKKKRDKGEGERGRPSQSLPPLTRMYSPTAGEANENAEGREGVVVVEGDEGSPVWSLFSVAAPIRDRPRSGSESLLGSPTATRHMHEDPARFRDAPNPRLKVGGLDMDCDGSPDGSDCEGDSLSPPTRKTEKGLNMSLGRQLGSAPPETVGGWKRRGGRSRGEAPMAIVAPFDVSRSGIVPLRCQWAMLPFHTLLWNSCIKSHPVLRLFNGRLASSVFVLSPRSDCLVFFSRISFSWWFLFVLHGYVLLDEVDANLQSSRPVTYMTAPDSLALPSHSDLQRLSPPAFLKAAIAHVVGLLIVSVCVRGLVASVWASEETCGRVPQSAFIPTDPGGGRKGNSTKEEKSAPSHSTALRGAESQLDRNVAEGSSTRRLYYSFGPEMSASAPRVVLHKGECVHLYMQVR
eukprot:Cvel_28832.t1-p1 / transcript=Cvel_28832.t1 / gene=Cvel_28832 / organism=Chromera_velia_CCMP2878 / gene_product=hypothetical protein / transcript_product=hypothetical protein / location=Cvel_scaffold3846:7011-13389(+) / protein_length=1500 / sequence_SO=supercontig / SO=protein_coding / is_pseudo=false